MSILDIWQATAQPTSSDFSQSSFTQPPIPQSMLFATLKRVFYRLSCGAIASEMDFVSTCHVLTALIDHSQFEKYPEVLQNLFVDIVEMAAIYSISRVFPSIQSIQAVQPHSSIGPDTHIHNLNKSQAPGQGHTLAKALHLGYNSAAGTEAAKAMGALFELLEAQITKHCNYGPQLRMAVISLLITQPDSVKASALPVTVAALPAHPALPKAKPMFAAFNHISSSDSSSNLGDQSIANKQGLADESRAATNLPALSFDSFDPSACSFAHSLSILLHPSSPTGTPASSGDFPQPLISAPFPHAELVNVMSEEPTKTDEASIRAAAEAELLLCYELLYRNDSKSTSSSDDHDYDSNTYSLLAHNYHGASRNIVQPSSQHPRPYGSSVSSLRHISSESLSSVPTSARDISSHFNPDHAESTSSSTTLTPYSTLSTPFPDLAPAPAPNPVFSLQRPPVFGGRKAHSAPQIQQTQQTRQADQQAQAAHLNSKKVQGHDHSRSSSIDLATVPRALLAPYGVYAQPRNEASVRANVGAGSGGLGDQGDREDRRAPLGRCSLSRDEIEELFGPAESDGLSGDGEGEKDTLEGDESVINQSSNLDTTLIPVAPLPLVPHLHHLSLTLPSRTSTPRPRSASAFSSNSAVSSPSFAVANSPASTTGSTLGTGRVLEAISIPNPNANESIEIGAVAASQSIVGSPAGVDRGGRSRGRGGLSGRDGKGNKRSRSVFVGKDDHRSTGMASTSANAMNRSRAGAGLDENESPRPLRRSKRQRMASAVGDGAAAED